MDKISIESLRVSSLIGVYEWERGEPQPLMLDITLYTDLHPAAESDQVTDTLDYVAIAECLQQVATEGRFFLLEALAGKMLDTLAMRFTYQGARLRLHKPNIIANAGRVSIELCRGKVTHN